MGTTKTDHIRIWNKTQIINYVEKKIQEMINIFKLCKKSSYFYLLVYDPEDCWNRNYSISEALFEQRLDGSALRVACIRWSRLCSDVVENVITKITMMSRLSSPWSLADIVLWRRVAVIGCHSAFVARHSSPRTSFLALPRDSTPGNLSGDHLCSIIRSGPWSICLFR